MIADDKGIKIRSTTEFIHHLQLSDVGITKWLDDAILESTLDEDFVSFVKDGAKGGRVVASVK